MATTRKPKRARRSRQAASRIKQAASRIKEAAGEGERPGAIALLKADHREVEELFKEFKKAESTARRRQIAEQICAELKIHTTIEEEIFYPAFLAATKATDIHNEAKVEHAGAKNLIAEIEAGGTSDPLFEARVNVLAEMIKHHVREEEKFGGMFAKARWSKMDLGAVGARMQKRKHELQTSPARRAIGRARANRAAMVRVNAMNGAKRAAREGARRAH
jgi:hemerythrin HHE cation binding domain-containing protein